MSVASELRLRLQSYGSAVSHKEDIESRRSACIDEYYKLAQAYTDLGIARKYLSLLADDSVKGLMEYMEQVIGSAIQTIFGGRFRFKIISDMQTQKLSLELQERFVNGLGEEIYEPLDFQDQVSQGTSQVLVFLFSIVLAEITGKRMLVLHDEVMSGLHEDTVAFIQLCISEFTKNRAQFVAIEYTFKNTNFGTKIVLDFDNDKCVTDIVSREVYEGGKLVNEEVYDKSKISYFKQADE